MNKKGTVFQNIKRPPKDIAKVKKGTLCENIQSSALLQKPFTKLSQGYLES